VVKEVDMKTKPNTVVVPTNALDSWVSYYIGEHCIHCDMVEGPGSWVFTPRKDGKHEGALMEPMTWEDVSAYRYDESPLQWITCILFHRKYHQFIAEWDGNWYGCQKCRRIWRCSVSMYD